MRAICILGVSLCLLRLAAQAQQPKPSRPSGADAFDDLPVSNAAKASVLGPHENAARKIRENIFVRAAFDRDNCYIGEQVMLTYRLYTALESNSTVQDKPGLDGWIAKERKVVDREAKEEERNGKHYRVFTIWEVVMTPIQAGDLSLDPLTADNVIGYTDSAGKAGHYSGIVSSNRAAIRVLPLPAAGKPGSFSGAVGKWVVRCRLSSPAFRSGDTDTLWVTATGKGSFDNLAAPALRWTAGLKALPPIDRWDLTANSFPDSGSKTMALPFTATVGGRYVLPAVTVAYFDPRTRRYEEAVSDSFVVKVEQSGATAAPAKAVAKTPNWRWWLGVVAVLLVGLVVGLAWRRRRIGMEKVAVRRAAEEQERVDAKRRRAEALAGLSGIVDEQAYLVTVKQLVLDWLREQLKAGNISEEDLLRMLRAKDRAGAAIVGAMLERCNSLLYSPGALGLEERGELRGRAESLITINEQI